MEDSTDNSSTPEMGCSASTPVPAQPPDVAGTPLNLPNSGLRFSLRQMRVLNAKMTAMPNDTETDPLTPEVESVAERLVQGIVYGAAVKDVKFKSKHLVILHKERLVKSRSLEYLVVMDSLQGNCEVAEGPPGCARLRPVDKLQDDWQDFLTPTGFLRRDKVIERWVEVLALAASGNGEVPSQDGAMPGLLMSSITHHHLQALKLEEQVFYGNVDEEGRFPSPRDFRIAIVEGSPWVRVRMAGGVLGSRGVEAKLTLGISYTGWPAGSDFPARAPLGHPDALLLYRAAQTGFFVVAGAPASGVQWSERSAGWQVWPSGARALLSSRGEGFARVSRAATGVLQHLRDSGQPPLRAVSRFMVEEVLLWRAECPAPRAPAGDLRSWAAVHMAHHLLCTFDTLLGQIRAKTGRHYLFPGCDVIKLSVWRGARIGERDWRGDADCLEGFLKRIHEESSHKTDGVPEVFPSCAERLESALCCRWGLVIAEATPAGSTRGRRLAGAPPYSPRQLKYVAAAARDMLAARQLVIQESNEWFLGGLSTTVHQHQDPIEDLIHLLAVILDQARDYFLKSHIPNLSFSDKIAHKDGRGGQTSPAHKKDASKGTLRRHKLKNCYDASAAYLIDAVRRDVDTQKEDLTDDAVLVRATLRWLYKAVDDDKKYLGPVLKPYLDLLFATSHENCWHLEEFRSRVSESEVEALSTFCQSVNDGVIGPAEGLVDAATKGWLWAEKMLDALETISLSENALRLIFPSSTGKSMKFDLSLPSDARERDKWNIFHANKKDRLAAKLKMAEQCVMEAFAFGLDDDARGFESTTNTSRSEEVISNSKNNNHSSSSAIDGVSTSHTLRSVSGTIDTVDTCAASVDNDTKYHTLRSLTSSGKYDTLRNSESLFGSRWSTGDTLRLKQGAFRPSIFEKDNPSLGRSTYELNLDDVESSVHCLLRDSSPFSLVMESRNNLAPHREYAGVVRALINMQRYSVLQELAGWISGRDERAGALRALHRLAKGGRRASQPHLPSSTQPPTIHRHNYTISPKKTNMQNKCRASIRQYYRRRNTDALSGDESSSKKDDKKRNSNLENNNENENDTSTSRSKSDQLDLEIQKEYLQNESLHDPASQKTLFDERYLDLCRQTINSANVKRSNAAFMEFNKEISARVKKSSSSSSVGRSSGKETKALMAGILAKNGVPSTFGKGTSRRIIKVDGDSLLGTCREARLKHASRRSVLPTPDPMSREGMFGDAFKVSQIYSGLESEYDTMTQSILQGAVGQSASNRQRSLEPPRDKFYP